MIRLRKWMILVHRYLGIALSLLFVVWFISGIGMVYAGGMPQLTPGQRLERLAPIDFGRIRLTPSEAAAGAGAGPNPGRVLLLMIMGRPAYRISAGTPATVFADNGERFTSASDSDVLTIAGRFASVPTSKLRSAAVLTDADQWTIGERRRMPLHKIVVDDQAGTELYVSPQMGEVVLETTRATRALAWAAAIPHWLYLAPLRLNDDAWRRVVLWTSGLGVFLAAIGLGLGVLQFSPSRPFRIRRIGSYIPYRGWMRWHYVTGVLFGIFTLTWVFSGLLSMEPWDWVRRGEYAAEIRAALSGGGLDVSRFPRFEASAWARLFPASDVKEIELLRVQGDPYYLVHASNERSVLVTADPLQIKRTPFSIDSLMARVREASGMPIAASELLLEYDHYYYSRDRSLLLPVLRVKLADPDDTWVYIDATMSRLVAQFTRQERLERWVYHGLHSLDFPFWYYNRPLWQAGVIALCLGGAVSSGIGAYVGFRRVARYGKRFAA